MRVTGLRDAKPIYRHLSELYYVFNSLSDLRGRVSSCPVVGSDEARLLAQKEGLKYCETSALTHQGLKVCFDEAVCSDTSYLTDFFVCLYYVLTFIFEQ